MTRGGNFLQITLIHLSHVFSVKPLHFYYVTSGYLEEAPGVHRGLCAYVNSGSNFLFFQCVIFRTIAALCLILILQNEKWRQNVTEVKAYRRMFLSTDIGYRGNIQIVMSSQLYRCNCRVIFHLYMYLFKIGDLALNRFALFLFLKISSVSSVGCIHFLCCAEHCF